MMKFISKTLIAAIVLFQGLNPLQTSAQLISDELKANISERVKKAEFPGISIAVFNAEGTAYYNKGKMEFGGSAEVSESTLYEIGSITKTFTAILLADQVQQGKMNLDDPIAKYLPENLDIPTRKETEITLRHLATHTSGLPRLPANMSPADMSNPYADYTYEQMYEFIDGYSLKRTPGFSYLYSNYAVGLLGHLLERHSGKSYEELVKEVIAEPLGMSNTVLALSDEQKRNFASGHRGTVPVSAWDLNTLAGAGGLRSNTVDMVRYIKANMGFIDTELRAALDLSHETAIVSERNEQSLALIWVYMNDDPNILWHNGGTGGFRTFAGFNKKTGVGVVVLTNSTSGADDIGLHVLDKSKPLKKP